MLRGLFLFLFVLVLGRGTTAQSGVVWQHAATFDTSLFLPNDECALENPPTTWSRNEVPLAPDGTDLVRVRILRVDYGATIDCANVSSAPANYAANGLYHYRVGHAPGLFHAGGHLYLAGHGDDQVAAWSAHLVALGAGGGGGFNTVWPGAPESNTYSTTFDGTTYPSGNLTTEIMPMSPRWLEPSRRGGHALWTTVQGNYSWSWAWTNGVPPPGWGSHSPLSYSMTTRVRLVGSVEYGHYE